MSLLFIFNTPGNMLELFINNRSCLSYLLFGVMVPAPLDSHILIQSSITFHKNKANIVSIAYRIQPMMDRMRLLQFWSGRSPMFSLPTTTRRTQIEPRSILWESNSFLIIIHRLCGVFIVKSPRKQSKILYLFYSAFNVYWLLIYISYI